MRRAPGVDAFRNRGFPGSAWFPHETAWIGKPYPDTMLQLERRGVPGPVVERGRAVQINLYTDVLAGLPHVLFEDRSVNWHQQQLGRSGFVAAAGLFLEARGLFVTLLQSDLCQQIFRHQELKAACRTTLDNRVGSWPSMLVNAVLDYAVTHQIDTVYSPTSDQILSGIRQPVDPALFRRIYDGTLQRYLCRQVEVDAASYWELRISENFDRVVPLVPAAAPPRAPEAKQIVLFHDIEENASEPVDPVECRAHLSRMLDIEARRRVHVTYNIVGTLFRQRAPRILADGHALGFHSYDHAIERCDQLPRVRAVDLQTRGYRPPQSVITGELSDYTLSYFNFEWLLTSAYSLRCDRCRLQNGIAKIPVHLDDHPLHVGDMDFRTWRARVRMLIEKQNIVAVGLHDCYAPSWLDAYDDLLAEWTSVAEIVTCDAVADRLFQDSDESTLVCVRGRNGAGASEGRQAGCRGPRR